MGAVLSFFALPALGGIGSILASCFSAAACSLACRSCNCNNSIATRVGYAVSYKWAYRSYAPFELQGRVGGEHLLDFFNLPLLFN